MAKWWFGKQDDKVFLMINNARAFDPQTFMELPRITHADVGNSAIGIAVDLRS